MFMLHTRRKCEIEALSIVEARLSTESQESSMDVFGDGDQRPNSNPLVSYLAEKINTAIASRHRGTTNQETNSM